MHLSNQLPLPENTKQPAQQAGTAILIAMLVVSMVAIVSISATWFQWRNFRVEQSQRTQIQASWLLTGAVDWAKLILLEDLKADTRNNETTDNLAEPWAIALRETKLSTFLALNKNDNSDIDIPVFLSGDVEDAQSRLNLRNLWGADSTQNDIEALNTLFDTLSLSRAQAQTLVNNLRISGAKADGSNNSTNPSPPGAPNTPSLASSLPLDAKPLPQRTEDIVGLGVSQEGYEKLKPFITILPDRTMVNVNTASKETLIAIGLNPSQAQEWIETRKHKPLKNFTEINERWGEKITLGTTSTRYFHVTARIRMDNIAVRERFLIHRRDISRAHVIWRTRI